MTKNNNNKTKKTERISFRVTPDEKELFEAVQRYYGITTYQVFALMISRKMAEMLPVSKDLLIQLRRIGNNLNQLAREVNTSKQVSDENALEVTKSAKDIETLLKKFMQNYSFRKSDFEYEIDEGYKTLLPFHPYYNIAPNGEEYEIYFDREVNSKWTFNNCTEDDFCELLLDYLEVVKVIDVHVVEIGVLKHQVNSLLAEIEKLNNKDTREK